MYSPVAETASKIREVLKAQFPGQKFSVKSKSYSGGSSVRITWTDGPMTKKVEEAVEQFESVRRDESGEILSGGNRYVFADRELSPEYEMKIKTKARELFGDPDFPRDYPPFRLWEAEEALLAETTVPTKKGRGFYRKCRDGKGYPCPNEATHILNDGEKDIPGCYMCEEHAQRVLDEYAAKLGLQWQAIPVGEFGRKIPNAPVLRAKV